MKKRKGRVRNDPAFFLIYFLYMTTELIANAGIGGFETRLYRPTLTGMPAIYMRIF
jgi:hypothetical protein